MFCKSQQVPGFQKLERCNFPKDPKRVLIVTSIEEDRRICECAVAVEEKPASGRG
jgi:hypothetical protein